MPTFKHPCPHCGAYIQRDVVACPACGQRDPFAPGRCPNCRTPLEDPKWVACPKCGAALGPAASPT
ncbi:MAG: zinc ribbon domain-containing protein [Candidatus Limnocylindrales bacterium]